MEYCDGGDLARYIKTKKDAGQPFTESQVMDFFAQIVLAVAHMHSISVLHRDLKTQNVFLSRRSVVKVGDFGIAKVLEGSVEQAKTVLGTVRPDLPCCMHLCISIPCNEYADALHAS